MRNPSHALARLLFEAVNGHRHYLAWIGVLFLLSLLGLNAYAKQLAQGLVTTGMGDEVSWGLYIANFTFLVGMAAAAVMMVIPAYLFGDKEMKDVVVFSELFAIAALIMCLLFITVDIGRPDRLWHLAPLIGIFNWPSSMLTWDVIVLNIYLGLNIYISAYLLVKKYRCEPPTPSYYVPVVILAIAWAPSIHTVTAFLYQGLGARPLWNSGLIAPRFIVSAFCAGPAFIVLVLAILRRYNTFSFAPSVLTRLRIIITVTLIINLYLLGSELFTEFYTGSEHAVHAQYLFTGLHGHGLLVPLIWFAVALNLLALFLLLSPTRKNETFFLTACAFIVVGIWIEKGVGFIIPGFIPSPLGDVVEYIPSANELTLCVGIWAFGLLFYSMMVKAFLPIIRGEFSSQSTDQPGAESPDRAQPQTS